MKSVSFVWNHSIPFEIYCNGMHINISTTFYDSDSFDDEIYLCCNKDDITEIFIMYDNRYDYCNNYCDDDIILDFDYGQLQFELFYFDSIRTNTLKIIDDKYWIPFGWFLKFYFNKSLEICHNAYVSNNNYIKKDKDYEHTFVYIISDNNLADKIELTCQNQFNIEINDKQYYYGELINDDDNIIFSENINIDDDDYYIGIIHCSIN